MPLDYRLSPDSPLLREGVFKRITSRSLRGDTFDPELEIELLRNGFDYLLRIDEPEEHTPFSLMQVDEFLALLSFPGITWFVSNRARLEPRQAALAILSGMPRRIKGVGSLFWRGHNSKTRFNKDRGTDLAHRRPFRSASTHGRD